MNEHIYNSSVFCKLSYQDLPFNDEPKFQTCLNKCIQKPIFLDGNKDGTTLKRDAQGYIFICEKTIFVTFRGSNSNSDVLTNLKFIKEDFNFKSKEKVHTGFFEQFYSIKNQMNQILYAIDFSKFDKIIFTGHSLGSALATITSLSYALEYPLIKNNIYCITFGSPRVGNTKFVDLFNKCLNNDNVFRFSNWNDPVTSVPPVLFSFRHTCDPIYLLENRQVIPKKYTSYGPNPKHFFQRISEISVKIIFAIFMRVRSPIASHSIDVYCERIEKFYSL
jgi:hypothetical protein